METKKTDKNKGNETTLMQDDEQSSFSNLDYESEAEFSLNTERDDE